MATLSEERTDVLGESTTSTYGHAGVDRTPVFDDVLHHRSRRLGARTLVVLVVVAIATLGVLAAGAATSGGASDDCFLISGSEYGGVTVVPGCGEVSNAHAQVSAPMPEASSAVAVTQAPSVASSQLWVPMPRLVVDVVEGLLG